MEITSPLQDIIKRAAAAKSGGKATAVRKRFEDATDAIVVLCDCSASMGDFIGSAGLTKHQHLEIALRDVMAAYPRIKVIAFASYPKEITDLRQLPIPMGGTALDRALKMAAKYKPRKTIIISDGMPDSAPDAMKAAADLTGAIDTIYCGPEEHSALDFLRQIARESGGNSVSWDGYRELGSTVRGFLPAPE